VDDDKRAAASEHLPIQPAGGEMTPNELRARLTRLHLERCEAEAAGLHACAIYMDDLNAEIGECREALLATRVTEIATARAQIWGPQFG
jgi:hypothetical protein